MARDLLAPSTPSAANEAPRNLLSPEAPEQVSPEPVKKRVAYLPDVDMTVDYPETMSGDRVNDAIQSDIYKRPRFNFYEDFALPLAQGGLPAVASKAGEKAGPETGKAVLRGFESSAAGVGSLSRWLGDNLQTSPGPIEKAVGAKMSDWGDTAFQFWRDQQQSGFEAPDPELFRGSFVSNPSWIRGSAMVAEAIPSLATAAAITFATRNTVAGAAALGFLDASTEYQQARDAGESFGKSELVGVSNAFLNTVLNTVSLSKYLSGSGAASGALSQAGVSGLQQISENMIAKIGYEKTRQIMDGVAESILTGAATGAMLGAFTSESAKQHDQILEDAQNAGVSYRDIQELRKLTAENIVKNAAEVEAIAHQSASEQTSANISIPVEKPVGRGGITPPDLQFGNWQDQNALMMSRETLERNLESIVKDEQQLSDVKGFIVEPIKENETARIEWMNNMRGMVEQQMKELGIKHGSLEDKLVQRYGEGRISLEELKATTPNYKEVVHASNFFREQYDTMLDTINEVREKFGYKPIQKRDDYFRHFQELGSWITSFGMILQSNRLPTEISGMTKFFQPGKPFTNAEIRRMGGRFTESAIGGIDNYIDAVSRQIFHTDSVQRARVLEKYIRTAGKDGQANLPNFVSNIQEYGNLLAGKKGSVDRAFESLVGREVYGAAKMIQDQIAKNIITGNVSSALSNILPVTQLAATTKKAPMMKGTLEAVFSAFRKDYAEIDGAKSNLLVRRFPKDSIAPNLFGKTAQGLNWFFKTVDQFSSKLVVASKYYEALAEGKKPAEAIKIADAESERILADRSVGQLPNVFGNKSLKAWTAFQVEVNNQMSFLLKDIPRKYHGDAMKIASAMVQFSIYSFLANNVYESVTGRRPQLDIIYAISTLLGATKDGEGKNLGERVYATMSDLRQNLPFTSATTGRNIYSGSLPDLEGMMRGQKTALSEFGKSGMMIANPFGGGAQIRKTIEGLNDYAKGGSFTKKKNSKRYPVEQSLMNLVRGALFGKGAFPEAVDYYAHGGAKGKKKRR